MAATAEAKMAEMAVTTVLIGTCTENRLPPVARDCATFKLIFTAAAREFREMQAMSGTAGTPTVSPPT